MPATSAGVFKVGRIWDWDFVGSPAGAAGLNHCLVRIIPDSADCEFFLGHLVSEAANVPTFDDKACRRCLIWCDSSFVKHLLSGDQTPHDFFRLRSFDADRDGHHLSPIPFGRIDAFAFRIGMT